MRRKLSKKRKQKEVASPSGSKPPSKKKSVADPELVERQKRAADRMVELGVSPQDVRIHLLKPALYRLIAFSFMCMMPLSLMRLH